MAIRWIPATPCISRHLLYRLHRDLDAFVSLFVLWELRPFSGSVPREHPFRQPLLPYTWPCPQLFSGVIPGQDAHFFGQAHVAGLLHETSEAIHIEYALGLDEIHPCIDFLCKADHSPGEGIGKRIFGSADEQLRRRLNVFAADYLAIIPHVPDSSDELDGIQIEDAHGFFLVAEALVVAREAQHIADTQGVSAEQDRSGARYDFDLS